MPKARTTSSIIDSSLLDLLARVPGKERTPRFDTWISMPDRDASHPAALESTLEPTGHRTFFSPITAQGRGAIAVVRVWGPHAIEIASAVFRPQRGLKLSESPRGTLRLGRIGRGLGDEVIVVVLDEPGPAVEIQCHGGASAVAMVSEALSAAGALKSDCVPIPGDFQKDPFSRDAYVDLAQTSTLRTAEILLEQMRGVLRAALIQIELWLDAEPGRAIAELEALIGRAKLGIRLVAGWRVAIAGRPNVGKSRLFNALVGFSRAIVDPTPGTTRDVVSFTTAFDGWPVELTDTAGLRTSSDPIEIMGMERARHEHLRADCVILVLDRSCPLESADHDLIAANPGAVIVASKSDLPPAWLNAAPPLPRAPAVPVSALIGSGIEQLIDAIVMKIVPEPPQPGAAVPFRSEQRDRLNAVRVCVTDGNTTRARQLLDQMINLDREKV